MKYARSTNKNPKCDAPDAKRIVIVDDHPLFRKGLEDLIHSEGSFAVCGEAGNAAEAMEIIRKLNPDLAIVDLSLPGANGIELIKNIRAEFPKLPILVLSMHDESLYALRALRAGAEGYVMKHEAMANVIQAIREVFNGRPYLSPAMAAQVITKFAHRNAEGAADPVVSYPHNHSLWRLFQFDHNFPSLSMLVGINYSFARDPIELRCGCVILDMK